MTREDADRWIYVQMLGVLSHSSYPTQDAAKYAAAALNVLARSHEFDNWWGVAELMGAWYAVCLTEKPTPT
jgi:hypothetical protein